MVRFRTMTIQRRGLDAPSCTQIWKHFGHLGATPLVATEYAGNLFARVSWRGNEERAEVVLDDLYRSYDGLGFSLARHLDDTGDVIDAVVYRHHAGTLYEAERLRVSMEGRSPPGWHDSPVESFAGEPLERHAGGYEGEFRSYLQSTYGLETGRAWDIALGRPDPPSIVPTVAEDVIDDVGYRVAFQFDDRQPLGDRPTPGDRESPGGRLGECGPALARPHRSPRRRRCRRVCRRPLGRDPAVIGRNPSSNRR